MTDASIRREPFPYAVVPNALPRDYYAALEATFPPLSRFGKGEALGNNKLHHLNSRQTIQNSDIPEIWQNFIEYHSSGSFFQEVCGLWGEQIQGFRSRLLKGYDKPLQDFSVTRRTEGKRAEKANQSSDIVLDCQFSVNSPVSEVSSVRGPHLDSPFKLFAALLYFRHPDDESTGGDFEIYSLKPGSLPLPKPSKINPAYVELVERVSYRPNTLVFFVNTHRAYHGVTPRSISPLPRRYVNFLGECYAGNQFSLFSPTNPKLSPAWRNTLTKAHRFKWALGL